MRINLFAFRFLAFCLLTILTQTGGLIYLISIGSHPFINKQTANKLSRQALKLTAFLLLYLACTFSIVPLLARPFGRVRLPIAETNHLKPLHLFTCLLNRNYVRPQLREAAFDVARQMNARFPGMTINYLDASFPFINKFPLWPHLSHNDGKKLDFAFCYLDAKTSEPVNTAPSFIGYGISEEPRMGELNTAVICGNKGYWQYSLLRKLVPQGNKVNFIFDSTRTKAMVNLFAAQSAIGKIFIEPHLKARLGLTTLKIRFHGCQAVRHDDHLHIQLK